MSVDLTRINSTRTASESDADKVIRTMPIGTLVRVRWLESVNADELDPGIDMKEIGNSDPVLILEWHRHLSFIDVNGNTVVEFTCLWRGGLYTTTSFCIDEVVREVED